MKWSMGALVAAGVGTDIQSTTAALGAASSTTAPEPCAVISSQASSYLSANPTATTAVLKPSEVYACLESVPSDQDKDTEQVAWIQQFLQFQSTLAYLKNPPSTYPLPAVDLLGGLDDISTSIANGDYTQEYDIELDLYSLVNSAHDGHLSYTPFLVGMFIYLHGASLVSVSVDGIQVPKIYVLSDVMNSIPSSSYTPSPVISINGQDVSHLENLGSGMQDLDALYNSVFDNPATVSNDGLGTFAASYFRQQGDTTAFVFENGTNKVVNASVVVKAEYATAIPKSGQAFFNLLTTAGSNLSSTPSTTTATNSSSPSSLPLGPSYPSPIVKHSQNFISGYFLNETENADVAVLNVASFFILDEDLQVEFLNVSSSFLGQSASAGKRRLIIDVRNNPGGSVALGYLLFQQLFPDLVPYSGIRLRDSEATNMLGQIASADSVQNRSDLKLESLPFNAQTLLQEPDGLNLTSWQQFYGPVQQHNDSFSNIASFQYSSIDYNNQAVDTLIYNGSTIPPQVFASEDITLLTDGQCSSTCATFANLLIRQGHVKSVTVGGRPNNQPMAVIGGVQGNEVLELEDLQQAVRDALKIQAGALGNSSAQVNQTLRTLGPLISPPISPLPGSNSVNLLDAIAENDTTSTPLQFSGGIAADCRAYYMPADMTSMYNMWARVARGVNSGGKGFCINGALTGANMNTTGGSGGGNGSGRSGGSGGRNGSAPLTFQGSANFGSPLNFGPLLFSVVSGLIISLLL